MEDGYLEGVCGCRDAKGSVERLQADGFREGRTKSLANPDLKRLRGLGAFISWVPYPPLIKAIWG